MPEGYPAAFPTESDEVVAALVPSAGRSPPQRSATQQLLLNVYPDGVYPDSEIGEIGAARRSVLSSLSAVALAVADSLLLDQNLSLPFSA